MGDYVVAALMRDLAVIAAVCLVIGAAIGGLLVWLL